MRCANHARIGLFRPPEDTVANYQFFFFLIHLISGNLRASYGRTITTDLWLYYQAYGERENKILLTLDPFHTRGNRSYIRGSDLYSHLVKYLMHKDIIINSIYLKIKKPVYHQLEVIEGDIAENASATYRYKCAETEKFGSLVESSGALGEPLFCTEAEIRKRLRYRTERELVSFLYDRSYPFIDFFIFSCKLLMSNLIPNKTFWLSDILMIDQNCDEVGEYDVKLKSSFSKLVRLEVRKKETCIAVLSGVMTESGVLAV